MLKSKKLRVQEDNATDDCTELSDSSPARPTPMHQPSEEEALLAAELFNCTSVPAICLVPPLPETMWERFDSTLQTKQHV